MAQLRQHYNEFVERETEILMVGPDSLEAFKKYWAKEDMPFVGLADPEHSVANHYEQQVSLWKMGRMPALLIVDKKGIVRFMHYAENMKDYPTLPEMYSVIDGLRGREAEALDKIA
jgi:peroxiredoxin